MNPRRASIPLAALAAALALAGCSSEKTCAADQVLCGGSCATLASDPKNCGACGVTCGANQGCLLDSCVDCGASGCKASVVAACFNTNDVRAFDANLVGLGAPVQTDSGPAALATTGGALYVATSQGSTVQELQGTAATGVASIRGGAFNDLEALAAYDGLLWVSNAAVGSLVVVDPAAKAVVDELSLSVSGDSPNPKGIGFAAKKAYVALASTGAGSPDAIAVVDLSSSPPWQTRPAVKRIDLAPYRTGTALAGAARVLPSSDGSKVFVTLNDIFDASYKPVNDAHGKLLVVDTATDAVTSAVDLGASCPDASGMALTSDGKTLWVGCGYTAYSADFTAVQAVGGGLLPVDVSGATPVAGAVIPAPHAVQAIAICGGRGYAAASDQGALMSFDPATSALVTTNDTACPVKVAGGFSSAFDLACAP